MSLTKEEQDEIDRLLAQIDATFDPLTRAWTNGMSKNSLDHKIAQAKEATRLAKTQIARIRRNAARRKR
jgi:hypothetical protein